MWPGASGFKPSSFVLDRWREHSQKPDLRNAAPEQVLHPLVFHDRVVLLAAFAACDVRAQADSSTYTVAGVDVDVNAADAVQARQQGLREARRKAAKMLVERMVAPEDRARVVIPDDGRLEGMVRGIEFVRERSAPNRYIATLNVVFQPDPVKAWLGESGVKIAETVSRPALVIPLWKGKPASSRSTTATPGARLGGRSTPPAARCR